MKKYFKPYLLLFFYIVILSNLTWGQSFVAITIDDVPNTEKYQNDGFKSILLNKLDSLKIPIAIFINESLLYKGDSTADNFVLLNNWMKKSYTTIGNHTSNHSRYSDVGIDSFKVDVEKGETILREMAKKYGKSVDYFRFPYNDLGKDSAQHVTVVRYMSSKNYKIAPFTVESDDWMYNCIYEYYLKKGDLELAHKIAQKYIAKTIEYFDFFDSIALKKYGRPIKQIYLCHDNALNANYLPVLLNQLRMKKYSFISLDEALRDNLYKEEDKYFKKWGISWIYRWMKSQNDIAFFQKHEPKDEEYKLYNQLVEEQQKK